MLTGNNSYLYLMTRLIIVAITVYLLNIPFGYWRANVKRFSWQWILAIHVPVAIVIALRFLTKIGFGWYTYVVLVSAFALGQQTGVMLLKQLRMRTGTVSSCLVIDLFHLIQK